MGITSASQSPLNKVNEEISAFPTSSPTYGILPTCINLSSLTKAPKLRPTVHEKNQRFGRITLFRNAHPKSIRMNHAAPCGGCHCIDSVCTGILPCLCHHMSYKGYESQLGSYEHGKRVRKSSILCNGLQHFLAFNCRNAHHRFLLHEIPLQKQIPSRKHLPVSSYKLN